MESRTSAEAILSGTVVHLAKELKVQELSWYDHPKFSGVRLKDLVRKDETNGSVSCHLVQVAPGCELGLHRHDTSMELHQVLKGDGECKMGERLVAYRPGCLTVIPSATPH